MAETPDPFKRFIAAKATECSGGRPGEPCADPSSHCIDVQNANSPIIEPLVLPGDGTDIEFPPSWSRQQIEDWRKEHSICPEHEPVADASL